MTGPATVTITDAGTSAEIIVGKNDLRPAVNAVLAWPADGLLPSNLTISGGTDVSGQIQKNDAQPKQATAQPTFGRNVHVATGGGFATNAAIDVTVTGTLNGEAVVEVITLPGNGGGATVEGVAVFDHITNYAWTTPAGWSAGWIEVQLGTYATVEFHFAGINGTSVAEKTRFAAVTNPTNKLARYTWTASDVATPGTYAAWFIVRVASGITFRAPGEQNLSMRVVS